MERRSFLAGALALAAAPLAAFPGRDVVDFKGVRTRTGGRLGVAAFDSRTGRMAGFDAHSRYAMCSTFKLPLVAAVLREVDRGHRRLDEMVPFKPADILEYAPVVRAHAGEGALPLATLAEAAIVMSDNSAANLLLPMVGGPAGLTRFFRSCGDGISRLDRREPDLNANLAHDRRDTTTPAAMLGLMRRVLLGRVLTEESRTRLLGWMVASSTGAARLRAGLPPGWQGGDKTGTGARGAANDIGIVWPPGRPPILIACYLDAPNATPAARDVAHAEVASIAIGRFA